MARFSPKTPVERLWYSFDFRPDLAVGEAIAQAAVRISLVAGDDRQSVVGMLVDSPVTAGGRVRQMVAGGSLGHVYLLTATATTSGGRVYELWAEFAVVSPGA